MTKPNSPTITWAAAGAVAVGAVVGVAATRLPASVVCRPLVSGEPAGLPCDLSPVRVDSIKGSERGSSQQFPQNLRAIPFLC